MTQLHFDFFIPEITVSTFYTDFPILFSEYLSHDKKTLYKLFKYYINTRELRSYTSERII